jgi:glycosyltransferase involved in cell wall biosynthesis
MRILMIAPQPFFEPRGTPFSEYHRIRALISLGHTVDLVTYPFGQDVSISGLRVFRCIRPPFLNSVRIGPSWAKVPLDMSLALEAIRRALQNSYDVVHSHEEGVVVGVLLAKLMKVPHLYDMHSSLPQQLSNFDFSRSRILNGIFSSIEKMAVRCSRVVVVICPYLKEVVRAIDPDATIVLIENAPGASDSFPSKVTGSSVRRKLGLSDSTALVLYTGTFEAYQGLDLLLASARLVIKEEPNTKFLLVGGRADQVNRVKKQAQKAGVEASMVFTGQLLPKEIPAFLDSADVLVSPRSTGWNTPLKIYQYLRSGKPIVATRLLTHTQVLNDDIAVLTGATPEEYAEGLIRVIRNPSYGREIGKRAKDLAETKYTYEAYLNLTRLSYAVFFEDVSSLDQ